jgi:hypothetical protein
MDVAKMKDTDPVQKSVFVVDDVLSALNDACLTAFVGDVDGLAVSMFGSFHQRFGDGGVRVLGKGNVF